MSTKLAKPIKNRIVENLQSLVYSGVLGSVVVNDLSRDPLQNDYGSFPVAIVGMSSIESRTEDNANNLREYIFPILILERYDNIKKSATAMEDLRDEILNVFDTDYTLNGTAIGAIEPSSSVATSESTPDRTYCYFLVTIKAKQLYQLGT